MGHEPKKLLSTQFHTTVAISHNSEGYLVNEKKWFPSLGITINPCEQVTAMKILCNLEWTKPETFSKKLPTHGTRWLDILKIAPITSSRMYVCWFLPPTNFFVLRTIGFQELSITWSRSGFARHTNRCLFGGAKVRKTAQKFHKINEISRKKTKIVHISAVKSL